MITLRICLEETGSQADLANKITQDESEPDESKRHVLRGELESLTYIKDGMKSGEPSVLVRIDLPDGRNVMAQTTLLLLDNAISMFRIKRANELNEKDNDVHGNGRGAN